MQLTAADQRIAINALGETITIGGVSVTADFRLESAPVQMYDGSVMSSTPVARITAADLSARSVTYGTAITARSVNYTVYDLRQEQSGLWLLILTKA